MDELGADSSCLSNATPKDDFGGGHADPNLTYAKDLVKALGLTSKGTKNPEMESEKVRPLATAAAVVASVMQLLSKYCQYMGFPAS